MGIRLAALIVFAMLAMAPPAWSQQATGRMEVDRSGKGAVLCIHWLIAMLYQYQLLCRPDQVDVIKAQSASLSEFEAFIARNSEWSLDEAQRLTRHRKQSALDEAVPLEDAQCRHVRKEVVEFVEIVGSSPDPDTIRLGTADVLSIDRKPVMNPCL